MKQLLMAGIIGLATGLGAGFSGGVIYSDDRGRFEADGSIENGGFGDGDLPVPGEESSQDNGS